MLPFKFGIHFKQLLHIFLAGKVVFYDIGKFQDFHVEEVVIAPRAFAEHLIGDIRVIIKIILVFRADIHLGKLVELHACEVYFIQNAHGDKMFALHFEEGLIFMDFVYKIKIENERQKQNSYGDSEKCFIHGYL